MFAVTAPSSPPPADRPQRRHYNSLDSSDGRLDNTKKDHLHIGIRLAQEWLHARFENSLPEDFCGGNALFYTAQVLQCPDGFEDAWGTPIGTRFRNGQEPSPEERDFLSTACVVLILADLKDKEQMKSVIDMGNYINSSLGDATPLLIYVPHSTHPDLRKPIDFDDSFAPLMHVIDHGIDEAIIGEPEGIMLALEIQNKVQVQGSLAEKFQDVEDSPEDQQDRLRQVRVLEEVMHDTVWDYLRVRLHTNVPAIDWSIAPGIPEQIENYKLGKFLGEGNFGSVFRLEYADGQREPVGSVLKCTAKASMNDMISLYNTKKQLGVMKSLSVDFPHPNIAKLYNVYHSESHLLFELEDCGPMDLYKFYRECEQRNRPLSLAKTQAIVQQLLSAVCHMHTRPKVVHCDLKPENIIISEVRHNVLVKIADFDTSQVDPAIPQYGIVGTFPFSAPEIVLERQYDPYAADVWSLGIVLLELMCFSQVLETALQLESGRNARTKRERMQIRRQMMTRIHGFFSHQEAVGCLLQENMRRDLHDMLSQRFLALLRDMLNVSVARRIRADRLHYCGPACHFATATDGLS